MCTARNQIESADAGALNISASKTVPHSQRVFSVELIVDAWVDSETPLPCSKYISEWIDNRECLWIERDCVDDRAVVDLIAPHIEKERSTFAERATQAAAVFLQKERCFLPRVGIASVPELIGKVEID